MELSEYCNFKDELNQARKERFCELNQASKERFCVGYLMKTYLKKLSTEEDLTFKCAGEISIDMKL